MTTAYEQSISAYWGRSGLGQTILDTLTAAGKDLDALTIDDLAPLDHYHGGGKGATQRLARRADGWRSKSPWPAPCSRSSFR